MSNSRITLLLSVSGLVLAERGLRLEALRAERAAVHLVGVVHVRVLVEVTLRREALPALTAPEE